MAESVPFKWFIFFFLGIAAQDFVFYIFFFAVFAIDFKFDFCIIF